MYTRPGALSPRNSADALSPFLALSLIASDSKEKAVAVDGSTDGSVDGVDDGEAGAPPATPRHSSGH